MLKNIISLLFLTVLFCHAAFANSIEVITLTDVTSERDASKLLIGANDEQIAKYFPEGKMKNQIAAFLVKFGGREILFDAGLKDGHVCAELIKNGVKPENLKTVLITHLHPDHFGGLVNDENKAAFPNAEIYISKPECKYWVEEQKNEAVINALKLYEGRLNFFDFGDEVVEGVKAIDTVGHTPGHTAFLIEFDGEKFLIVGDIMHFVDIQLPVPDVAVVYDVDPVKAIQSRKFILDYASQKNIPIAGMHISNSGIINVRKNSTGYEKF